MRDGEFETLVKDALAVESQFERTGRLATALVDFRLQENPNVRLSGAAHYSTSSAAATASRRRRRRSARTVSKVGRHQGKVASCSDGKQNKPN